MSTAPGRIMGKPSVEALRKRHSGRVADHPGLIALQLTLRCWVSPLLACCRFGYIVARPGRSKPVPMRELISRILMAMSPIMIVCGLLASGATAMAQSADKPCSNRTLFGDYGSVSEGSGWRVIGRVAGAGALVAGASR